MTDAQSISSTTSSTGWMQLEPFDPLAQTFFVEPSQYPAGLFLSSLDLYFKTKDIKEAYLPFSHNEENEAKQFLNNLGIGDSEKFVCLIVRDSEYLSTFYPKWDWTYHGYRDTSINIYREAIEALANQGYWIFRMGKKVKKPLSFKHD